MKQIKLGKIKEVLEFVDKSPEIIKWMIKRNMLGHFG